MGLAFSACAEVGGEVPALQGASSVPAGNAPKEATPEQCVASLREWLKRTYGKRNNDQVSPDDIVKLAAQHWSDFERVDILLNTMSGGLHRLGLSHSCIVFLKSRLQRQIYVKHGRKAHPVKIIGGRINLQDLADEFGFIPHRMFVGTQTLTANNFVKAAQSVWLEDGPTKGYWGESPSTAIPIKGLSIATPNRLPTYEFIVQPIDLLPPRGTPRASETKTRARNARTFDDVREWEDFVAGIDEVVEFLRKQDRDNPDPNLYWRQLKDRPDRPSSLVGAADEAEVRAHLMYRIMEPLSEILSSLGYRVQFCGGGSNRWHSYTDAILRQLRDTDLLQLNKHILSVIEVKGVWQFYPLDAVMLLKDAIRDDAARPKIIKALQQVFDDSILDETRFLLLTNDCIAYLMRRSESPGDKWLEASPPIYWDASKGPPPLAAFLYFAICVSTWLGNDERKRRLPADDVPCTLPKGYSIQGKVPETFLNAKS